MRTCPRLLSNFTHRSVRAAAASRKGWPAVGQVLVGKGLATPTLAEHHAAVTDFHAKKQSESHSNSKGSGGIRRRLLRLWVALDAPSPAKVAASALSVYAIKEK